MKNLYLKLFKKLFLACLFAIPLTGKAAIVVTIESPKSYGINNDKLSISVAVTSTYALDTIQASVGDSTVMLTRPNTWGSYTGSLSLTGFPQGRLHLNVFVKDILGNIQTAGTDFTLNSIPTITIVSPQNNDAYQSKIHVKAYVKDPGSASCAGMLSTFRGQFKLLFVNSIDTLIDVIPERDAATFDLVFTATDSVGQEAKETVNISCDKSPHLTHYFTGNGEIVNFKDTRILVKTTGADRVPHFSIVNIPDSSLVTVPIAADTPDNSDVKGFLCKIGAYFISNYDSSSGRGNYELYVWKDDQLVSISKPLGTYIRGEVQASGNNLMWLEGNGGIAITDLTSLNTQFTGSNVMSNYNYLSPEGVIAYSAGSTSSGFNVYKYNINSHTTTQVTNSGNNLYPSVDHQNLVYIHKGNGDSTSLYLNDGLTDYNLGRVRDAKAYLLRDGYLFYNKFDQTGTDQVWLRTPGNTIKQLSFFSAASLVDKLGSNGSCLFANGEKRFYADSLTSFTALSGSYGTTYYENGAFYLALGNTLLKYDIPGMVTPSPVITAVSPSTAVTGTSVVIKGIHLTGATYVKFGVAPAASFTVNTDTSITAIVGAGGSGEVQVITPGGKAILGGFKYIYSLPVDNFKIAATSASCKGTADGRIHITAAQKMTYHITVTGKDTGTSTGFTDVFEMDHLPAGTYSVCISAAEHTTYQQCFTVVIKEPENLSVYMAVNKTGKQVTLSMTGANSYHLRWNGNSIHTSKSQISLDLKNGANEISVSTDQLCQGIITRHITIGSGKMIYPNPFENIVKLDLGENMIKTALITLYNETGSMIYTRLYTNHSGVIQLDLSALPHGFYVLKLVADKEETTFKLLKK